VSAKKKLDSKAFAQQKRKSRRLLTFYRICRYGLESFIRNSWLSVAAVAVMTITLLIIFTAFAAQNILTDTISDLGKKVDMSIYLKTDTTDKVGADLKVELEKLSSVRNVTYVSSTAARADFAQKNGNSSDVLAALNVATNMIPASLKVVVKDINNTTQLQDFVKNDTLVKKYINPDPNFKPSFASERRNAIEKIAGAASFAQKVGIVAGSVFVIISSLIIFNTISMAIFNRKEEIQMMKLIGADKWFIRGPFVVEAIIYGIIAAFIATGIGIFGLYKSSAILLNQQISVQPTIDFVIYRIPVVLLAMIAIGAVIGIISSLLATRRYLKL
jgi:cell division transport system permease protein